MRFLFLSPQATLPAYLKVEIHFLLVLITCHIQRSKVAQIVAHGLVNFRQVFPFPVLGKPTQIGTSFI
jgi:hypothetical protein